MNASALEAEALNPSGARVTGDWKPLVWAQGLLLWSSVGALHVLNSRAISLGFKVVFNQAFETCFSFPFVLSILGLPLLSP